ncbi:MAG: class I SAM-dependent methyltransferase [Thermodesulfobacteriota bacterium]
MNCRFCRTPLEHQFIDLVSAPLSNAFLTREQLDEPEVYYPLKLYVCHACFLVQIDEYKKSGDIFKEDYAYFSSFSSTWLDHARRFVDLITGRLHLGPDSFVIEIAANDGYLLQYFLEKKVPCLGIEPSRNTAAAARAKGIEVITDFFGRRLAAELAAAGRRADLLIGNNVLAHVPDLHDFVGGLPVVLKEGGVVTMEFPHLMRLVDENQFDTVYHEHFSYFSLHTVEKVFARHGLVIFDVEELPTHGGSLRIYAARAGDAGMTISESVARLKEKETARGLTGLAYYQGFQEKADRVKYGLLDFLVRQKREGRTVAAYGAAAKGNTLLNYCGVKKDLIAFVADRSPHKQGKFLPGSHIPVVSEEELKRAKPDYVLILPWNIKDEIMAQLDYIRAWGGRFVVPLGSPCLL